jgi:hypothetical protein
MVEIADMKKGRSFHVVLKREEFFCRECSSTECAHAGFSWGVKEKYFPKKDYLLVPDRKKAGGLPLRDDVYNGGGDATPRAC